MFRPHPIACRLRSSAPRLPLSTAGAPAPWSLGAVRWRAATPLVVAFHPDGRGRLAAQNVGEAIRRRHRFSVFAARSRAHLGACAPSPSAVLDRTLRHVLRWVRNAPQVTTTVAAGRPRRRHAPASSSHLVSSRLLLSRSSPGKLFSRCAVPASLASSTWSVVVQRACGRMGSRWRRCPAQAPAAAAACELVLLFFFAVVAFTSAVLAHEASDQRFAAIVIAPTGHAPLPGEHLSGTYIRAHLFFIIVRPFIFAASSAERLRTSLPCGAAARSRAGDRAAVIVCTRPRTALRSEHILITVR